MPEHTLFPSYVLINYHSEFAKHTQTIQTRLWSSIGGTGSAGAYEAWDTSTRDAEDMINDLVDVLKTNFPASVTFDNAVVYNFPSETQAPNPVAFVTLGQVGTEGDPGWYKAVQNQITMYDTDFLIAKIVMLDAASFDDFAKRLAGTVHTGQAAVFDELADANNAWASRANNQILAIVSATTKLNDELRKQYDMA